MPEQEARSCLPAAAPAAERPAAVLRRENPGSSAHAGEAPPRSGAKGFSKGPSSEPRGTSGLCEGTSTGVPDGAALGRKRGDHLQVSTGTVNFGFRRWGKVWVD